MNDQCVCVCACATVAEKGDISAYLYGVGVEPHTPRQSTHDPPDFGVFPSSLLETVAVFPSTLRPATFKQDRNMIFLWGLELE